MQEIAVGGGKAIPQSLWGLATAVLAMMHCPLPPMVFPPVLGGCFVRQMRWAAAAPAGESRIRRHIGHFAASGSVAGGDLRHSIVAFRIGGKLGIMRCRA
jgi:hypothetical protein